MSLPKRFALLGDPVSHSKSPAMHAAAYRAGKMPHTYEALRVAEGELPGLVRRLREGEFDGFNVTVPHKQRILQYVDEVQVDAAIARAANTLVRLADGRIRAHNTDAPALALEIRALAPDLDTQWGELRGVVVGAGGAARSAIVALAVDLGMAEVGIRARGDKGQALVDELSPVLRQAGSSSTLVADAFGPSAPDERRTAVVVQATSAGMVGAEPGQGVADVVSWADLPARAVALDVVYAPRRTPFLVAAEQHGVRSANGIGMLARQGSLAFALWLDAPPPYNAMLTALI